MKNLVLLYFYNCIFTQKLKLIFKKQFLEKTKRIFLQLFVCTLKDK